MKTIFIGPVVRLLFRPWIKGLDNIPDGPAILASNHMSFSDSIFLPLAVPRPVVFLAKSEYFNGRGLKGRMTAAFFRLTHPLPLDRSGGAASASSLSGGADVLNAGGLLGIYPEGTRSPDGRLYRGKTGVAKLVLSTGVPVVPVAMIGTDKVQPIGRRIPNIRRVGTIIGKPLYFSRYKGLENDRFIQRSVTDEIMYEIMRLSGQEYVDVYANTVKAQQAARKSAKAGQEQRKAEAVGAAGEALQQPGTVKAPGAITIIGNPESLAKAPDAAHTERAPSAQPDTDAASSGATDIAGSDDSGQSGGGRKPRKPGS